MTYKQPTRLTNQKQAILEEVLRNPDSHRTAEDVHQKILKQLPRISLATVYRNLHQFSQNNQLSSSMIQGVWRFESPKPPHYHAICLSCQEITDINSPLASDIEDHFKQSTHYTLTSHDLVLFGLCPSCNQPSRRK